MPQCFLVCFVCLKCIAECSNAVILFNLHILSQFHEFSAIPYIKSRMQFQEQTEAILWKATIGVLFGYGEGFDDFSIKFI